MLETATCPVCGGPMFDCNKYCCLNCWKKANGEE
jgi:hypothetical protein